MTNRIKSVVLVLSGVILGCGAAATVNKSWAGPTPGQWACYKQFPYAEDWPEATQAMNAIASSAPRGTVATMQWTDRNPIVCVRD